MTIEEKVQLWNQFQAIRNGDKTATKFKIRNIALQDEIGDNLYNIERALDENRDKKRRVKERQNLRRGIRNPRDKYKK